MKKLTLLTILGLLGACSTGGGGNHSAPAGAPGKSAYEIWLEQGNVGTEQDFLDSLVGNGNKDNYPNEVVTKNYNKKAELDELVEYGDSTRGHSYKYTSTPKPWVKQDGFVQYTGSFIQDSDGRVSFVYNEKELKLGNYGVHWSSALYNSGSYLFGASGYVSNRDIDYEKNIYKPKNNTTFKGGTLAYIYKHFKRTPQEAAPTLIKGDVTFIYNSTNPHLILDFDNYYKFDIKFDDVAYGNYGELGAGSDKTNVTVSGMNGTSNNDYDLQPGTHSGLVDFRTNQLKQGNVEEAFGMYSIYGTTVGGSGTWESGGDSFTITGAFGGTKQ